MLSNKFKKNGFLVFQDLFSVNEINEMRETIFEHFKIDIKNHNFSERARFQNIAPASFDKYINSKKLLKLISEICGEPVDPFRHNDIHIDQGGGVFHRDAAERKFGKGDSWSDPEYKIFRVAIYLSSYKQSGSSLYIIPGSHKNENLLLWLRYKIFNKIWNVLRKKNKVFKLPHSLLFPSVKKIKTNPGTTVVFDPRLIHAGGHLFGDNPKLAIFLSFAVNNHQSKAYLRWLSSNGNY